MLECDQLVGTLFPMVFVVSEDPEESSSEGVTARV
jgi:hypothetical protein